MVGLSIVVAEIRDDRVLKAEQRNRQQGICTEGVVRFIDCFGIGSMTSWEINAKYEVNGVGYYTGCKVLKCLAVQPENAINVWYMPDDPNDGIIMQIDALSQELNRASESFRRPGIVYRCGEPVTMPTTRKAISSATVITMMTFMAVTDTRLAIWSYNL